MADPSRRRLLAATMVGMTGGIGAMAAESDKLAWDFSFPAIEGGTLAFAAFKGRVLLVTNTASFCGYTYQYEALEKLHAARSASGLTVVGVPSQDFNQESADNKTVKDFCDATFGVEFPMSGLAHVRGPQAAPFYAWVSGQRHWQPAWNFNKVLIGRDGRILGTFGSSDEPNGPALTKAIDSALAAIG
jgi:glutathione peroxidase